jgi:transaldolase
VDELIGENTVNTVPPKTLNALLDHAEIKPTLQKNIAEEEQVIIGLGDVGISIEQVTNELEEEGVASFSKSFNSLLDTIAERSKQIEKQV